MIMKMLAEGKNGSIPKMPFEELCDLLAEAIKAVSFEKVIKNFKQTHLSLPIDGFRDQPKGSKKLLRYIVLEHGKIEVDVHGIRRRKAGAAEKYQKRIFICKLWAYSNKYVAWVRFPKPFYRSICAPYCQTASQSLVAPVPPLYFIVNLS